LRIFFETILFSQFPQNISFQKNVSSSFFQYSERTINSTETNDTSKERSDTQLFSAEKFEGVALPGGLHVHLQQKDIKKSKFDGANSGSKKHFF
jgi:hypothetical protein